MTNLMPLVRAPAPSSTSLVSRRVEVDGSARLVVFSAQMPPVADACADPRSIDAFGNTHRQTLGCLERVSATLKEAGLTLENLVAAKVYLVADPASGCMDFEGFNSAWSEFFAPTTSSYPARTVVQVAGLVNPGWLIEIEPLAARA